MHIELEDGLKIIYDEHGNNDQRHVLFIHGLGSSSIAWGDIPEALSEHFHTIAVDLIGFGKSDKPQKDYTIAYFSQFIKNFLRQIGINDQDKITIIGHSLGGYIATYYAIENKEQIDKLVLTDSSGMLSQPTPLLEQYLDAAMETDSILRYKKIIRVFEDMLADRSRFLPVKADVFIDTIEKPGAKHSFQSAYKNSTTISLDLQKLKQIKDIPCLIIWGKNDTLIPPNHADIFKDSLNLKKEQVFMVEDAGHSPQFEKPTSAYEKIRTFLI